MVISCDFAYGGRRRLWFDTALIHACREPGVGCRLVLLYAVHNGMASSDPVVAPWQPHVQYSCRWLFTETHFYENSFDARLPLAAGEGYLS